MTATSLPTEVRATMMRGGTSKCWVFKAGDVPGDPADRDRFLTRVFGSPDHRQIDGVGGATSTTSKALIVTGFSPVTGSVEYEFAQVGVGREQVEWESNCGNCASSLGIYAVQEGMVAAGVGVTRVPLFNTHTGLWLDAEVDTPGARPPRDGEVAIPGTVYPGARVSLRCTPQRWSTYRTTLPTGNPVDTITVDGRRLRATLIDAGAPAVLVPVNDLDLGPLWSLDFDACLPLLFEVRRIAAGLMGIPDTGDGLESVPKVGLVGAARPDGGTDLEARMVSMSAAHPSIGITSAIAVAAATGVPGSAVAEVVSARWRRDGTDELSIGTAAGPVRMGVEHTADGSVGAVTILRSARRLADATLYLPR